jgi:hypothetical protein
VKLEKGTDKVAAMYPLSKNKASFRIADILHQQQQTDSQLLAHHLMLKNVQSSEMNNLKAQSNESKNSPSKSPSPDEEISTSTKGESPMKPQPMYSNFPLPFPLGMHPAFHSAAYLNYADAIHKGETVEILPQTCGGERERG